MICSPDSRKTTLPRPLSSLEERGVDCYSFTHLFGILEYSQATRSADVELL